MKTMKKYVSGVLATVLAVVMTLSMSACGISKEDPKAAAEKAVTSMLAAVKKADFNEASKYTVSGNTWSDFSDDEEMGIEVLKPILNKMSYTISSSEQKDDNTVSVSVDINTIDSEKMFETVMTNVISEAMTNPDWAQDGDAVEQKMMEMMKETVDSTSDKVSNTIVLKVVKQDKTWKISDDIDETAFANAITGNLMDAVQNIGF